MYFPSRSRPLILDRHTYTQRFVSRPQHAVTVVRLGDTDYRCAQRAAKPRDLSTLSIDRAVVSHESLQDSAVSGGLAVARYLTKSEATNSIRTAGDLAEGDHLHETCLLSSGDYWRKDTSKTRQRQFTAMLIEGSGSDRIVAGACTLDLGLGMLQRGWLQSPAPPKQVSACSRIRPIPTNKVSSTNPGLVRPHSCYARESFKPNVTKTQVSITL